MQLRQADFRSPVNWEARGELCLDSLNSLVTIKLGYKINYNYDDRFPARQQIMTPAPLAALRERAPQGGGGRRGCVCVPRRTRLEGGTIKGQKPA